MLFMLIAQSFFSMLIIITMVMKETCLPFVFCIYACCAGSSFFILGDCWHFSYPGTFFRGMIFHLHTWLLRQQVFPQKFLKRYVKTLLVCYILWLLFLNSLLLACWGTNQYTLRISRLLEIHNSVSSPFIFLSILYFLVVGAIFAPGRS